MGYPFSGWMPNAYNMQSVCGFGQSQYNPMGMQSAPQPGNQAPATPFTMVPTVADVDKVVAQPGETKWIMVQNEPVLAVKTANTMGYASSEYYRLAKIDPAALQGGGDAQYLTAAQAEQKIQAAVKAEVERVMAQYQTAPAAPAKAARGKEG